MESRLFLAAFLCCLLVGFGAPACAQTQSPGGSIRREVAVTFDDLPEAYAGGPGDVVRMRDVTSKLVRGIKAHNIPAIGFVNEGKLYQQGEIDERAALLRAWLDAGLELGNHNFSHAFIDRVPLADYQEEIIRGETVTRMLLRERGMKLKYYRHTELKTGPTPEHKRALEQFLAARGYTIAPVTVHNHDFVFARLYADAKARGDRATMKRIADAYVPYMERMFEFFENLSRAFLGYEVKQTLILHANELNADHLDALVRMMRGRGYSFITLEEALKDKAYQLPDAQVANGPSWIARWMIAQGRDVPYQPSEPEFIREMFAARRR